MATATANPYVISRSHLLGFVERFGALAFSNLSARPASADVYTSGLGLLFRHS